jgi:hypothetical protein
VTFRAHLTDLYREGGASGLAAGLAEWSLLRSPLATPDSREWYWRIAPQFHRVLASGDTAPAQIPPDPFALHWVDPDRISKFTRRWYPTDVGFESLFGSVRDGDWDVRPASEVPRHEEAPTDGGEVLARDLFYAERLEETTLYESFAAHFEEGVEWTDTEFVAEILERTGPGRDPWHGCHDRADVLERCRWMDETYGTLESEGFVDPLYRARTGDTNPGFVDALSKATVVDVGRDGDLLLVDGRHRLCMAKILGLERVPVVLLVRHEGWMERRDAVASGEVEPGDPHPDLPPFGCAPE